MAGKRPSTIAAYIDAAPAVGQPHLQELYALLKRVAPDAQEAIKWGTPFFIEPRFLFGFSAHKAHLSFAPGPATMEAFRDELASQQTTRYMLQVPYDKPLHKALIRKLARHCLKTMAARSDDKFW